MRLRAFDYPARLAIAAICLATAACTPAVTGVAPTSDATSEPPRVVHGAFEGALDREDVLGIPLADALAKMSDSVSLPSTKTVGLPVKVVLDENARADTGRYGLLIAYDSGIDLNVGPGEMDLEAEVANWDKQYGGGKRPFDIEVVSGRKSIVNRGGDQVLGSGTYREGPVVTFNLRGMTYSLSADDPSMLGELMAAANSIR